MLRSSARMSEADIHLLYSYKFELIFYGFFLCNQQKSFIVLFSRFEIRVEHSTIGSLTIK